MMRCGSSPKSKHSWVRLRGVAAGMVRRLRSLTSLLAFSEAAARRQWQGWTDCYLLGPPRVCVLGLGSLGLGPC